MPFEVPEASFDATDHARNAVLRANQFQELVITQFKMAYEDFWGVEPARGSKYTAEQMQAKLNAMPMSTAIDILTDAGAFKEFVTQAYPDALPVEYHEAAWNYTLGPDSITVIDVKAAWLPPVEEE